MIIDNEVISMSDSPLRNKSKEFAKQIVLLCREIKSIHKESVLTNQLLRSGTSIGANLHEAQYAQGTKDFISKFEIALKECYETEYWLELLFETGYIPDEKYKILISNCGTIRRMLISSVNTVSWFKTNSETVFMVELSNFILLITFLVISSLSAA